MIQKIHFGKRIAAHRKALSLSQADLAQRLGVTAQAVSKWETGSALPDVELLLALSHLYGVSINELLEDRDMIRDLSAVEYTLRDGVAVFPSAREHSPDWAAAMVREGWVSRNWAEARADARPLEDTVAQRVAEKGGLILELGAGPGGGFVPHILFRNPDAAIVLSDLSPTVVREWRSFLDRELDSPNLSFAAFDYCRIPFRDNSFDFVTDRGGIANAIGPGGGPGDKAAALREACRVLKPGGVLATYTGFVTREDLAALPPHAAQVLRDQRPDVFQDLYEETVLAGFSQIDSLVCGHWDTDGDDSDVAELACSLGVNLRFTGYLRFCVK